MGINKNLIPIKVLLFFFYGAFGCLWPFLSLHMKYLGLTLQETAIINLVTPFTSLLGPPLVCLLVRKTGRQKSVLVACLVISALGFGALTWVPPTERHEPRLPDIVFECGHQGGRVHVERCDNSCELPERSPGPSSLSLRHCRYVCDERLAPNGPEATAPVKPYVCVGEQAHEDGRAATTTCSVYNASGDAHDLRLSRRFLRVEAAQEECIYPFLYSEWRSNGTTVDLPSVNCRITSPGCVVHCLGVIDFGDPEALDVHACQRVDGHPLLTFGAYLLLRLVAEFFAYSALALTQASTVQGVWEFGGLYSQQLLWGMLGVGLLAPFSGILVDTLRTYIPVVGVHAPAFLLFEVVMLVTVVLVCALPSLRVRSGVNRLGSYCRHVLGHGEVVTLFVMAFFLGTLFGFLETFYYWFLDDRDADCFFIGLTMTVGILPAIPLFWFGDRIVDYCGHANLLIAAFFAYAIRMVGYSFLDDHWYFLPFETLRVLANHLMWVAAITYCEKLGPKMLASTISGTVSLMHSNVGRGVGALAGGYLMSYFGAIVAFQVTAVYAGIIGLIYMAVYHFHLKDRRSPIYIETTGNGHYTPMETYTNGDNQANKPMLENQNRY